MKIKCRLVEAEQIISEMEERLIDVADDIAETEEDTQLIVSGWGVFLPQLNLQLHEGILCNWDEEEQMFMPDVAVTVSRHPEMVQRAQEPTVPQKKQVSKSSPHFLG